MIFFLLKFSVQKKPTSTIEFTYEIYNNKNEITTEGKTSLAFVDSITRKPLRCPSIIDKLFD